MENDPRPLARFKPDDAPADPQEVGIQLMRVLREIQDETAVLLSLCERWADDPIAIMHKTRGRVIEVRSLAILAPELGQQLMRACRAHGTFSTTR
jgi:hypothetical protein